MAAGNFTLYNSAIEDFFDGTQDFENDNHYVVLLTDSYTPAGTHATLADVVSAECADGDYAPQNLAGEAVTESSGTTTCDADDVSFGSSVTITAKYAAVVVGTVAGKDNADLLTGYVELDTGGSVSSTAGNFDINWHANGLFTVAAA